MTTTITEIAAKLKNLKSVLIFCHSRPDGDTLSSGFALQAALQKLGIEADVTCADSIPEKYAKTDYFQDFTKQLKQSYDAHIAVDCASEGMIGSTYQLFQKNRETYVVDHHISNTRYAKYCCVVDEAANAINIFDLICALNVTIDAKMADMIYLGICTDTGNFSQANATQRSFEVASQLVKLGANPNKIYNAMFRSQSEARARLYASVMNGLKLFHDGKLAVISIREADFKRFGVDSSVTEGFIDFPLSIGSVEVAVSIMEKSKESFKISFRSKYQVDVNQVASTFGGGGHVRASGAMLNGIFEDVVDKIVFTVGNYL